MAREEANHPAETETGNTAEKRIEGGRKKRQSKVGIHASRFSLDPPHSASGVIQVVIRRHRHGSKSARALLLSRRVRFSVVRAKKRSTWLSQQAWGKVHGGFVSGVVIDDEVNIEPGGYFIFDLAQESEELLLAAVARFHAADDDAGPWRTVARQRAWRCRDRCHR